MTIYKRQLFPLFLILFTFQALSQNQPQSGPKIKTGHVYARQGESLRELLESRLGISSYILDNEKYFEKIIKWNPRILDLNSLKQNTKVYIEIPYRVVTKEAFPGQTDSTTLASQRPNTSELTKRSPSQSVSKSFIKKKKRRSSTDWKYSFYYAFSRGTLEESIQNTQIVTQANQDSPITLAILATKEISNHYEFISELSISKIDGGLTDQNEEVSMPLSGMLSTLIQYTKETWPLKLYTGFELERFSSYNTEELPQGEAFSTREHTLGYVTLGVAKDFKLFNRNFNARASYATTVFSQQSRPSLVKPETYSGTKIAAALTLNSKDDWFYHAFYRMNSLDGATALTISRMGLGVGLRF